MKKRLTVGVVTAECYRDYIAEMICGVIAQSNCADCNVIVLAARNNFQEPISPHIEHEADIFKLIELPDFDGFIYDQNAFAHFGIRKKLDSLLKRTGKPVMMLDAREHPFFENTVSHDPETFALLIEHMIQVHGYKKIYCLTGTKGTAQAEDRLRAYFSVMQRHGYYYDDTYYTYGDFWRNAPVKYAQRLISGELAMPEAVVCANDIMADSLIAALSKACINVPSDIAVTGFDGYLDDPQSDVSLTTFPKSCYQLGIDAFRRLYTFMTGRNCRRAPSRYAQIQIGRSCGCVPVQRQTEKSRRERHLVSRYKEWFYHSEVLFELIHTNTLYDLLYLIASRIYLVCHWRDFRIFLTDRYLRSLEPHTHFPAHADFCEVLWTDRAGKSSGIKDVPMKQSDIISYLTNDPEHPSAYYLSLLHMDERQFGIAALSFGRLPCCYQSEYCTLISYLCLAFEQLEEKVKLGANGRDAVRNTENPQLYNKLVQIREEMQQNPEIDWSVQELCRRTHVSRSYLQRTYKRCFGKSIFEELIDFRIMKAKELLFSEDLTFTKAAELCGYSSYAHFAKQFKAHEGITLSEFREKLKSKP